jgi:DNA repair protein RecO (recombination protein O)
MKAPSESSAGFVLHSYPYLETSLIVETFTRTHGRVAMVAKGAKRPHSAMRSLLNPFQRLRMTWFGKGDMKTLKTVEHERIFPQLSGAALMSCFYMNELLLKLAHRDDAHEALFDAYENALAALVLSPQPRPQPIVLRDISATLRNFELALLRELGYALQLTEEAGTHAAIAANARYFYVMERGPIRDGRDGRSDDASQSGHGDALQLMGKTLLDLSSGDFSDPVTQQQAKQLMRRAINHLLGDKPLHTRQLIRELKDY